METKNKIKYFLENPEIYKRALVIDDEWGTGKSTIVNKCLSGGFEDFSINEDFISNYRIIDICDIDINYNFIFDLSTLSKKINLNNDITEYPESVDSGIKNRIANKLSESRPLINNLTNNIKKIIQDDRIGKTIANTGAVLTDMYLKKKKDLYKYVLVIDEMERCNDIEKMEWLLLKLSKLQENHSIRLILIMNTKKMKEKSLKTFKDWEDKISSIKIGIDNNAFFNETDNEIFKHNKNRNIRLIEKYRSLEKEINNIVINKMKNNEKNELIIKEIEDLKIYIYEICCEYYEEISDDVKITDSIEVIDNSIDGRIKAEDLSNLDFHYLEKKIESIIENFSDINLQIYNGIKKFKSEILNKIHFKMTAKQSERLKILGFEILRNEIFKSKDIFLKFEIRTEFFKRGHFDQFCIFSYIDFMKQNFILNKEDENYLVYLIHMTIQGMKEKFINADLKDKLYLWDKYTEITDYQSNGTILKTNINKPIIMKCNIIKNKFKLCKKIDSLVSYMYKELMEKNILEEEDFNKDSPLYRFHCEYNINILNVIYQKNGNQALPLIKELYDIKKLIDIHIKTKYSGLSNKDQKHLLESKLDNMYKIHNLNKKRGLEKISKSNHLIKLPKKLFLIN